jgi:hypothetical protein
VSLLEDEWTVLAVSVVEGLGNVQDAGFTGTGLLLGSASLFLGLVLVLIDGIDGFRGIIGLFQNQVGNFASTSNTILKQSRLINRANQKWTVRFGSFQVPQRR